MDPPPLDGTRSPEELAAAVGQTITADGIGGTEALRVFIDALAPATISIDHPRFLSFVPAAPTEASILFDLVVGASSIYGGSWLEGAGAAFAENQALRWLADLAGFPADAGGVFVSGGTAANLERVGRGKVRVARAHRQRGALGDRGERRRTLVDRVGGASHGRVVARRPHRRAWSSHRRSTRRQRSTTPRVPATSSRSSRPRAPRTPASSTTSAESRRSPRRASCGCTSTARTALRHWPRRAHVISSLGSSAPTRSASTRTSGCSRRSTARLSSTADPRSREPPTRSTPRTSRCCRPSPTGTRRTTRSISPGALAACRSGSRWRPMAPMRTATRSSRRSRSPARWRG